MKKRMYINTGRMILLMIFVLRSNANESTNESTNESAAEAPSFPPNRIIKFYIRLLWGYCVVGRQYGMFGAVLGPEGRIQ